MSFVIVPNSLSDAIYQKIDAALSECPDAVSDREIFYHQLLDYFNEHGVIPDLQLVKTEETVAQEG